MKLNVILLIGLFLVSLLGCEGPEGSTGPMGPEGSAGPQGEVGPAGNSDLSVIEFNFSLGQGNIDGRVVFYDLVTSLIDEDVINNGTVIVQLGSAGDYAALPLTDCYDETDNGEVDECYELTYSYELNKLTIQFSNTSESINWNPDYRLYLKASIFGS